MTELERWNQMVEDLKQRGKEPSRSQNSQRQNPQNQKSQNQNQNPNLKLKALPPDLRTPTLSEQRAESLKVIARELSNLNRTMQEMNRTLTLIAGRVK